MVYAEVKKSKILETQCLERLAAIMLDTTDEVAILRWIQEPLFNFRIAWAVGNKYILSL